MVLGEEVARVFLYCSVSMTDVIHFLMLPDKYNIWTLKIGVFLQYLNKFCHNYSVILLLCKQKKSEKFRRVKYFLIKSIEKWRLVQTQSFLNEEFMSTGFQSKAVRLKSELYSLHLDLSLTSIWLVQVIFNRNNLNIT